MIRTLENARLQAMALGTRFYEIGIFQPAGPGRESQMLTCVCDLDAIVKSIRAYVQLLRCLLFPQ